MVQSGAQAQSAPPDVGDPLVGRVLNDKFRIVEALGAGGMGRVYKAVQAPLERLVAIKVLNPQYSEGKDPGFQKRFFLEAAVTARLRHPNTVTIIDYGKTDDGVLYIAMEYLEGQTLAQLLTQHGPLPWMRVMNIGAQVARSLREAHKVGLIHRDLKPANIMVLDQEDDHDVVKVLDFGLVKSFLPDRGLPNEAEITQAGVILGSPQYMAPEQARNIADPRSDVYSLGVVLYQMLLGRPPFLAEQSIDIIVKHLNEPPPAFSAIWPDHTIPPEVEALVMKCLAKRPADRFDSMDGVLDSIRRATANAGVSGVFSGPRSYTGLHGTGAHSGPLTGPLSPPTSGSGASTMSLDISVEEPEARKRRNSLPMALFGGSVLIGVGVVLMLALRTPSAPAPVVLPPEPQLPLASKPVPPAPEGVAKAEPEKLEARPAEPPAPAEPQPSLVRFVIASEPSGARVMHAGRSLGETPLELQVPADEQGHARAELTFELAGYPRATVTAEGEGPEVRFTHRLKKKSSRPRKSEGSVGYKDDPYQ